MIALVLFLLFGGELVGDFAFDLPNGYRCIRTNAVTVMIWTAKGPKSSLVVPPNIVKIGIQGDFVFGKVEESPESELADRSEPGYFILNTRTQWSLLGLPEEKWRRVLAKRKVKQIDLKNPRAFATSGKRTH